MNNLANLTISSFIIDALPSWTPTARFIDPVGEELVMTEVSNMIYIFKLIESILLLLYLIIFVEQG